MTGHPDPLPISGIIFQSLEWCPVVDMLENLQNSIYSHCGILHENKVIHSGEVVEIVPFERFVEFGRFGKAFAIFTTGFDAYVFKAAEKYLGMPYDVQYDLGDPKSMYCSKLIWRAMLDVGLPVPESVKLGTLDTLAIHGALLGYYNGEIPSGQRIVTPAMLLPFLKKSYMAYPPIALMHNKRANFSAHEIGRKVGS